MSLTKKELNECVNEINGKTVFKDDRCIIAEDFKNPQKVYIYDLNTKKLLFDFDEHGKIGDYFKVKKDEKVGIFSILSTSIHIPLEYKEIDMEGFENCILDNSPYFVKQLNDKIILLDFYGERLNYHEYNYSKTFKDGVGVIGQIINNELKYGIVLEDGTHLFNCKYDSVLWSGVRKMGMLKEEEVIRFFYKDSPKLFEYPKKIALKMLETFFI